MRKLLTIIISTVTISLALLAPSLTSAYDLNQGDQDLLQVVYTKINEIKQTNPESITSVHTAIQKVLPKYQGRSHAILDAIINYIEQTNPHLKNYDGKLTIAQLLKFKQLFAIGDINSSYLLLEYSDIECPFCERFMTSNTIIDFVNSYPGVIKKTFRHYPLSFHQRAMPTAIASECINQEFGLTGMYPYIRMLMASKNLTDENIKATAESLNLWNQTIATCIDQETTKEAVQAQIAEGRIFNVTGTPSSVILDLKSGKRIKISGAVPLTNFITTFDAFSSGKYKAKTPVQQAIPQAPTNTLTDTQLTSLLADIPLAGSPEEILIIEYGDIECPFCRRQVTQKTIETVVANNPGTVSAIFQHFPLSFHPNAQPAAEAAECLKQETTEDIATYYDYLYELFTTNDLSRAALIDEAVEFGANRTNMEECLDNNETAHLVTQQMTRGQTLFGARGTPANVILNTTNGQWILVSGAQQPAAFQSAIDKLLTK